MYFNSAAIGRQNAGQVEHFLLRSLAGIRIRMKMNGLDHHAALCHHPCGHRTVDAAGQENHSFAVGSQRQTAEPLDLIRIDVGIAVSHIDIQNAVRLMNIHLQNFTMFQHRAAYAF